MVAPRRPQDDPELEEADGEDTLTDALLDLPDDLDLEDPLARLERQFSEDDEEFEDEVTQPLQEIDISALETLDDPEDEPDDAEEVFVEDLTTALEFPELLDADADDGFIIEDEDEDDELSVLVEPPEASPGVVLPWETEAVLPDLGITLPAILDPTMEQSFWMVAELGSQDRVRTLVQLPGVELEAVLVVRSGRKSGLRLGRDVLAGRVLISC